jgi:hypothetical protein
MKEEVFYVYRHIRIDKNEPFYIGVGKVYRTNTVKQEDYYSRAFQNTKRSRFWNFVAEKTLYEVEIIFECNSREEALQKEIEFIALYGRRDLGKGTLVNLTDGGDGMSNNIQSEETLKKRRDMYYQGKTGLKPLKGENSPVAKKVEEIKTGRIFNTCTEAANYLNINLSNFIDQLSNTERKNTTGFRYVDESNNKEYICRKRNVKVYDYSNNTVIESISEASRIYSISQRMLGSVLDGKYRNKTPLVYYEDYLKGIEPNDLYVSREVIKKVLNKITGEIYESINEAVRKNNIPRSTLRAKLNGRTYNNTYLVLL